MWCACVCGVRVWCVCVCGVCVVCVSTSKQITAYPNLLRVPQSHSSPHATIRRCNARCTNPVTTSFWTAEPNIGVSPVWYLMHVAVLVPSILRWPISFWTICALLYLGYGTQERVMAVRLTAKLGTRIHRAPCSQVPREAFTEGKAAGV